MVVTDNGLDFAKEKALDVFDSVEYMAIGSGTNIENPNDTTLGTEEVRDPIDTITKNITNGTYEFETSYELGDAAGDTITEVGLFDSASLGNMYLRKLLPVSVSKTSATELIIGVKITATAENKSM